MSAIKILGEYRVFLRAFEGIFLLCFALACLAVSWFVRQDPIF